MICRRHPDCTAHHDTTHPCPLLLETLPGERTNVVPIAKARKRDYQILRCGDGCSWAPPPAFSGSIAHEITFPCPLCGVTYHIDPNVQEDNHGKPC